jgi:hypothetical protein
MFGIDAENLIVMSGCQRETRKNQGDEQAVQSAYIFPQRVLLDCLGEIVVCFS